MSHDLLDGIPGKRVAELVGAALQVEHFGTPAAHDDVDETLEPPVGELALRPDGITARAQAEQISPFAHLSDRRGRRG